MNLQLSHSVQFLQRQVASLLIYQSVFRNDIGQAFLNLLQTLRQPDAENLNCLYAYGQWFQALAAERTTWQAYLLTQILKADNPFSQQVQRYERPQISADLIAAVQHDLRALQSFYRCNAHQLAQWVQQVSGGREQPVTWDSAMAFDQTNLCQQPIWSKLEQGDDWAEAIDPLITHYRHYGTGLFADYRACRWHGGQLVGIAYPDPIQLPQLVGYEMQRDLLIQNTEALLAGFPALHVLLYGSRGSGKSSLVKALLHTYGDRGLRLIEVSKSDLRDLISIVEQLRQAPQKFIVFVDDLSFEEDEDAYKALKVVLEGNLTARPQNMVVYATSNRRHLIREFFGDRPRPSDADEVHSWDTVQEKLSFSDRFGLTLTFEPADQTTYLAIVRHLATLAEISLALEDLDYRALQWATRHNGRSGRTARQFIDFLKAELATQNRCPTPN